MVDLERTVRELAGDIRDLERAPLAGGTLVSATLVAATPYRIVHGLGRPFRGWIVTRKSADANPYEVNTSTTDRRVELWLQASAGVTLELYVF